MKRAVIRKYLRVNWFDIVGTWLSCGSDQVVDQMPCYWPACVMRSIIDEGNIDYIFVWNTKREYARESADASCRHNAPEIRVHWELATGFLILKIGSRRLIVGKCGYGIDVQEESAVLEHVYWGYANNYLLFIKLRGKLRFGPKPEYNTNNSTEESIELRNDLQWNM